MASVTLDDVVLEHGPPSLMVDDQDVLDWDFSLEETPDRPSGRVVVRIRPELKPELAPNGGLHDA